jgi:outer membrane protein assembly factor BamB
MMMRHSGCVRRVALLLAVLIAPSAGGCDEIFGGGGHDWLAWTAATKSGFEGRPGVDATRVFIEADSGVAAFDQRTGTLLWEPRLRDGGMSSILLPRAGRVFSAEVEVVRAYDAETGAVAWRMTPPGSGDFAESAMDDRALYVGTRNRHVLALDPADGSVLWDVDAGPGWEHQGVVSGIAVAGDTVYAAVRRNLNWNGFESATVLVALHRGTGAELWRFQTPGTKTYTVAAPTLAGRLLLLSDRYSNAVIAVDRFTAQQVWRTPFDPQFTGPYAGPAVADGVAYVGSGDTHVYALDVATGAVRWRTKTAASIFDVAVCGNRIVMNNNDIEVLDRRTGRRLGTALTSTSSVFGTSRIAVANGLAFVVGSTKLYAVRCG